MKVDLNGLTGPTLDSVKSSQRTPSEATTTSAAGTEPTAGEDAATLSVGSSSVNSLIAKALDAPAIRQDKVEALRQTVQNGEYKVDPALVAEAMIRQSE
jgi:flagellar biosynthesis anti-sigma factor FlgM